jgi:trehalose 6-phosphate phosphatase
MRKKTRTSNLARAWVPHDFRKWLAREGSSPLRPEVQSALELFLRTVAVAPESALLLDYDGTLAPFHTERDQAFPYPGVALLLQEMVRHARTRVVVITGRDVNDLLPLLDIHPRPEIWGSHGLQRLRPDGTPEMPHLDQQTLNGLSDAERWLSYKHLRHRAEFKPGGIAIHWRGLSALDAADLRARVLLGWRPIVAQSGLDLLEFDGGIEIRARQANKGDAVRAFLTEISVDTPVAYLGDDNTDESAFLAIGSRGLSILVRPELRETSAQLWLKPPEDVIDFLRLWLRCSAEGDAFSGGAAHAVNG